MYNLPPSGGGGGGGGNGGLGEILTSVATLAAIVLFFASPLGGLFFAVINSFFVLSLLVPVVLWIGFQGWQFFNTIEQSPLFYGGGIGSVDDGPVVTPEDFFF